jgi:hypothetical protein
MDTSMMGDTLRALLMLAILLFHALPFILVSVFVFLFLESCSKYR